MAKKQTTKAEPKSAKPTNAKGRIKKLDSEPGEVRLLITQADADAAPAKVGTLTMLGLAEHYLKSLEEKGAGPGTIASYGMELKTATKHLGAETSIADLTEDRVRQYFESDVVMKKRNGKSKAPPTYLKTQRVLRLALIWATERGLITSAPIPKLEATA